MEHALHCEAEVYASSAEPAVDQSFPLFDRSAHSSDENKFWLVGEPAFIRARNFNPHRNAERCLLAYHPIAGPANA